MALNASITFEFRSTGSSNNGGGWKTSASGTDYSTQDAAQWTATDLTCAAAATNIVSAASTFTTAAVGNVIHLTALTGTGALVGWYEITAYVDAHTLTLDRTPTDGTNAITAGTFYIGGALNVGGSLEDDFFEEISGAKAEDGIAVYFYNNNSTSTVVFTPSEAITIAGAGGTLAPIKIIGYKTTRGDNPTGSSRPTIAMGANVFSLAGNFEIYNLISTGTGNSVISMGINDKAVNCKSTNSSTTIDRNAFLNNSAADVQLINCEGICYRGKAYNNAGYAFGCYFHDSNIGIQTVSSGYNVFLVANIIESNVTAAINSAGALALLTQIIGNTLYGSENTTGSGIVLYAAQTDVIVLNNIIYGFVTGVSHGTAGQTIGYDDYNDYYNNDTDVSNWTKGSNDQAVNPTFTNVAQVTGTAGTYAVKTLTDAAANFGNVVDNQDFVYIISGTGMTAGQYLITAHDATTITTDLDAGENVAGDVVYQVTTGRNFAIGTNLKALGFPGAFQAGLSTGYMDIGAVQRQEPAGGGGLLVHSGMTGGMRG